MLDLLVGLRAAGTPTDEIFLPDHHIEPIASCSTCVAAGACGIGDDFAALMTGFTRPTCSWVARRCTGTGRPGS